MIGNKPFENRRIIPEFVWWKEAFSTKQLDIFESMCSDQNLSEALIITNESENIDSKVRISKIKFFERNDKTGWIFDIFNNTASRINDEFYQFDLYGYNKFQYTVYDSSEKGKYDWHMDTIIGQNLPDTVKTESTRKLTMIMLLNERNEFEGGDFQLNMGQEKTPVTVPMERGTIIAFPSFMIHRVTPVLSGIRKSIVIWVEGPKFR